MLKSFDIFSTDIVQAASIAVRFRPRSTDLPSVIDEPVAELVALLGRDQFPQCHLHPFWFLDIVD